MAVETNVTQRNGHVASADVVVSTASDGSSRCTTNRTTPPLTFRSTPIGGGGARLTSVGTAAGPVGGDELLLEVDVQAGARLAIDSAGATMVLPGPHGDVSSLETALVVGAGAAVHFWSEPTVLVAACRHRATTRISVGSDARLVWAEELVLGRHGEPSGACHTRLIVDRVLDGVSVPLLRTGLDVGGIGWQGGAVLNPDTRLVAQALLVGVAPLDVTAPDDVAAATTPITEDAWLVTVVASTTEAGRTYLTDVAPTPDVVMSARRPAAG